LCGWSLPHDRTEACPPHGVTEERQTSKGASTKGTRIDRDMLLGIMKEGLRKKKAVSSAEKEKETNNPSRKKGEKNHAGSEGASGGPVWAYSNSKKEEEG